jgi:ribulose-phosphate 3-epimerase
MVTICPTVTAYNAHTYRTQMERVEPFAKRVHIDLMDGDFAPTQSIEPDHVWWPDGLTADIHVMFRRPATSLPALIKLRPRLVIIHAEAEADFRQSANKLHEAGIKAGLALLQDTLVKKVEPHLKYFDHVLVFSGHLGHHGGEADLKLLDKVRQIQELHPHAEIGWDGGINDANAKQLVDAGVDILNVGGYIQDSTQPNLMFNNLQAAVKLDG